MIKWLTFLVTQFKPTEGLLTYDKSTALSSSFPQLFPISTLHLRNIMDTVDSDRNTVIDWDDRTRHAAETRLEKTTNSQSSQTQKSNIQEINRDVRQTDKIYHFQNCGTVYVGSFNARGVRMENCGNNIPQFTCSLLLPFRFVLI